MAVGTVSRDRQYSHGIGMTITTMKRDLTILSTFERRRQDCTG